MIRYWLFAILFFLLLGLVGEQDYQVAVDLHYQPVILAGVE